MSDTLGILNWRILETNISSSGQPTEKQFAELHNCGVKAIINLAPEDHKDALACERELLLRLGTNYTNIPVPFGDPSEETFNSFVLALQSAQAERVHIHCIFNARVTAYWYRYICECKPQEKENALISLESIWRPGREWAKFIGNESRIDLDHEYAVRDY